MNTTHPDPLHILTCGHLPSPHSDFTTGYATHPEGHTHCYECVAELDRQDMIATGKATLYFEEKKHTVTNWPGSLSFPLYPRIAKSRHNFGIPRYDYWFVGPDNFVWHGYTIGNMTQIAHCQRTQETR